MNNTICETKLAKPRFKINNEKEFEKFVEKTYDVP
jgi:hypothetical protein